MVVERGGRMYDVLIVGCGVVGAAVAYQLSKYELSVCICERYNDVALSLIHI